MSLLYKARASVCAACVLYVNTKQIPPNVFVDMLVPITSGMACVHYVFLVCGADAGARGNFISLSFDFLCL